MTNIELLEKSVQDFTRDFHVTLKSLEKIEDAVSYVKKHPETGKDLAQAESIRTQMVVIGETILTAYNLTLTVLK